MVRKKTSSTKRASIFASPGKVLMIERNRVSSTSFQTSKGVKSPLTQTPNINLEKSLNSTKSKSRVEVKKRKTNQTTLALREIRKFQNTTRLLIPKSPFSRTVREIAQSILGKNDIRFTAMSLMALQEATEMAIVNLLEIANLCCLHAKRVTLTPADIRLTRRAFGLGNPLNN